MDVVDVTVSHGQGKESQNRSCDSLEGKQLPLQDHSWWDIQWLFLLFSFLLYSMSWLLVCVFDRNLSQRLTQLNWKQMAGNTRQKVSTTPVCHGGAFLFSQPSHHQDKLKVTRPKYQWIQVKNKSTSHLLKQPWLGHRYHCHRVFAPCQPTISPLDTMGDSCAGCLNFKINVATTIVRRATDTQLAAPCPCPACPCCWVTRDTFACLWWSILPLLLAQMLALL